MAIRSNDWRRRVPLIELSIVVVTIALLAAFLPPSLLVCRGVAKEARCQDLIGNLDNACIMYERDWKVYPPSLSGDPFNTGPCVYVLSRPGPKKQPYMDFGPEDVSSYPISSISDLINPIGRGLIMHYRNNTMNPPPRGVVPVHNMTGVDIWARNLNDVATGINNWRMGQ